MQFWGRITKDKEAAGFLLSSAAPLPHPKSRSPHSRPVPRGAAFHRSGSPRTAAAQGRPPRSAGPGPRRPPSAILSLSALPVTSPRWRRAASPPRRAPPPPFPPPSSRVEPGPGPPQRPPRRRRPSRSAPTATRGRPLHPPGAGGSVRVRGGAAGPRAQAPSITRSP